MPKKIEFRISEPQSNSETTPPQCSKTQVNWRVASGTLAILILLVATGYALSPLHALTELQRAVSRGDTLTLTRKVVWPQFKTSLKNSLRNYAFYEVLKGLDLPGLSDQSTRALALKLTDDLVEQQIECCVTPNNLREIARNGSAFRGLGLHNSELPAGVIKRFYFIDVRTFSIELGKPTQSQASLTVTLALRNFDWKLIGIDILSGTGAPITETIATHNRNPSRSAAKS